MRTLDWETARGYAIPLRTRFRGIMVREGMLIEGPAGWGEFCPFIEYDDRESISWLATAVEQCTEGWPEPVRERIPVNCTVPVVGPARAHEITAGSGCRTIEELAAVRRRVDVRIAADESIRRAEDPLRVAVAGAADVAVIKCTPLGGVRRSLQVAEAAGLPCVVSSALETSVGLAAQLALAGALPELDFACGLGTLSLLDGDVVAGDAALRPVDGY